MIRLRNPSRRPRRAKRLLQRVLDVLLAAVLIAALAVVAARLPGAPARLIEGDARVADGDSLVIADTRIRLEGIDAPELGQSCERDGATHPCGREARAALARLVGGARVSCESRGLDRFGRALARCEARGVDLNRSMVEEGWAVAYGDYRDAERAARAARRGLWAGTFDTPRDWRQVHGGPAEREHDGLSRLSDWLSGIFRGGTAADDLERGDQDEAF